MMNARFVRYSKKVSRLLRKMEQAMEKERNAKELRQGLHAIQQYQLPLPWHGRR
jgi:hypothetical protein